MEDGVGVRLRVILEYALIMAVIRVEDAVIRVEDAVIRAAQHRLSADRPAGRSTGRLARGRLARGRFGEVALSEVTSEGLLPAELQAA